MLLYLNIFVHFRSLGPVKTENMQLYVEQLFCFDIQFKVMLKYLIKMHKL